MTGWWGGAPYLGDWREHPEDDPPPDDPDRRSLFDRILFGMWPALAVLIAVFILFWFWMALR